MKSYLWLGFLLISSLMVSALGGMSRPVGLGYEQGYDQPTLNCPSCYDTQSLTSQGIPKSSQAVKSSVYATGQHIVPSVYVGTTYAPNWYLGLANYYRHRGIFKPYNAKNMLGDEKGLSIVQSKSAYYQPAKRATSGIQVVDGRQVLQIRQGGELSE